jgi:hypothetical protein
MGTVLCRRTLRPLRADEFDGAVGSDGSDRNSSTQNVAGDRRRTGARRQAEGAAFAGDRRRGQVLRGYHEGPRPTQIEELRKELRTVVEVFGKMQSALRRRQLGDDQIAADCTTGNDKPTMMKAA